MLTISVQWIDSVGTYHWVMGNPFPVYSTPAISKVIEVWADGPELEHIAKTFTNIPLCDRLVEHSWYGDTAKFIVGCLSRYIQLYQGKTGDAV